MKLVEQAIRNAELILPKLEHVKTRVGGAQIHNVDVFISTLTGSVISLQEVEDEHVAQRLLTEVGAAERYGNYIVVSPKE